MKLNIMDTTSLGAAPKGLKSGIYTKSDYDETYEDIRNIFKFTGIRISQNDSRTARFWYNMYYWFQFLTLLLALFCEIAYVTVAAQGGSFEDVVSIFSTLPCISYLILTMLKGYKMVLYRSIYETLIDELRAMWPDGKVSEDEHSILSRALKELKFVVKAYICSNYLLTFSYFVACYFNVIRRAFGYDIPRVLPFHFWLYIDLEQPKVYEFILVLQNWQTNMTVWFMICGDLLFCIFLSHITTQFDLMALRIKKLVQVPIDNQLIETFPLAVQSKSSKKSTEEISFMERESHQELVSIVKRHAHLIRLSNYVEDIFSFALFINFLFTSLIICFCGFCCVIVEKWNETTYKVFLMTSLSQTGLMCWYGQKLVDSSTGVADAIYGSGWYMTSKKIKSMLLIILHRSQKKIHVTTYGFSTICLASYATIIKSAWSYFTILMNTYKK